MLDGGSVHDRVVAELERPGVTTGGKWNRVSAKVLHRQLERDAGSQGWIEKEHSQGFSSNILRSF